MQLIYVPLSLKYNEYYWYFKIICKVLLKILYSFQEDLF